MLWLHSSTNLATNSVQVKRLARLKRGGREGYKQTFPLACESSHPIMSYQTYFSSQEQSGAAVRITVP